MEPTRRGLGHWPRGWWCPQHPWPPAWARSPFYSPDYYPYSTDPSDELRQLEELKRGLESDLADITKRLEELKKTIEQERR